MIGNTNKRVAMGDSIQFPVQHEGYVPTILRPDYLDLLHKNHAIVEPVLVLRGIHALARGLLEHAQPAQIDRDFAETAHTYFAMRGSRIQESRAGRNSVRATELRDDTLRRGWSFLVAEDTSGLIGIIESRRVSARGIVLHPERYRTEAHTLFITTGDKNGAYVNATQGLFLSRLRGMGGLAKSAQWFGRASIAADGADIRTKKDYTPAQRKSLMPRAIAEQAFLSNIFSHDGLHVAR